MQFPHSLVELFIGSTLQGVDELLWSPADDPTGTPLLKGIVCSFAKGLLVFHVRSATDSVDVTNCDYIKTWIDMQNEPDEFSVRPSEQLARFIGRPLVNVWKCSDVTNVVDSIDISFGDLVFPQFKLFCVLSELHVLNIQTKR